jgi:translation initiation factor IF-2
MQPRRLRLGDILDDYCPRERRVTNHVVVAMIDDDVKQTRCTTCDADHEYKAARVPPPRRKRADAIGGEPPEGILRPRASAEEPEPMEEGAAESVAEAAALDAGTEDSLPETAIETAVPADNSDADAVPIAAATDEEEGPVHRRLIRATLPRPEGQSPERKEPDFTIRQPGGRGGREFDGNEPGSRFGHGRRPMRAEGGGGQQRFGGPRQGSGGQRTGSGQGRPGGGSRPGHPGGPRGNRPGQGAGRGGGGRKRGR